MRCSKGWPGKSSSQKNAVFASVLKTRLFTSGGTSCLTSTPASRTSPVEKTRTGPSPVILSIAIFFALSKSPAANPEGVRLGILSASSWANWETPAAICLSELIFPFSLSKPASPAYSGKVVSNESNAERASSNLLSARESDCCACCSTNGFLKSAGENETACANCFCASTSLNL